MSVIYRLASKASDKLESIPGEVSVNIDLEITLPVTVLLLLFWRFIRNRKKERD